VIVCRPSLACRLISSATWKSTSKVRITLSVISSPATVAIV